MLTALAGRAGLVRRRDCRVLSASDEVELVAFGVGEGGPPMPAVLLEDA